MRSTQVHRALLQIPNRYALCQTISASARLLHKTGDPIDGSLNTALEVLSRGSKPEPVPAIPLRKEASSLYRQMQYAARP
jgi:hypothetical protein